MSDSPQEFYGKMALREKPSGHNKSLGDLGEKQARRYLRRNGWKILEKNFKNPFGEVDVIAVKGGTVAFIEVKTRLSDGFGTPAEAVSEERKRRYISAAKYYFAGRATDCTVRFDIIEIFRGQLNHIENAFYA